ncbi:MAG TPA: 16S rRNA (cytosine(1402)-N(4))-methyltransferase RsmH [Candidatus Deferrimicrobium sp.]|nr:16S rRNA (cytosine(1402)-N(4))-methyltransferase RsmH [Candidatus Deferrimicrobium sp.]
MEQEVGHLPVMLTEVILALSPHPGSFQIDATVGGGGHASRILEAANPDGRLLGIDADPRAIERSRRRLAAYGERVTLRRSNFEDIASMAAESGFGQVDGILMDLGVSSQQLDDDDRGFSFRSTERLDMRFDMTRGIPANEVIATYDEAALVSLFRRHGEEPHARRIAHAIVTERARRAIETPAQLAELIAAATPRSPGRRRIHPATRVFQALRIEVNRELETLPAALEACLDLLKPDGRLCVISYHSLEDRIVKRFLARERQGCTCPPDFPVCVCGRVPRIARVGSQPQVPSHEEVAHNPRARSARLRAARRLAA